MTWGVETIVINNITVTPEPGQTIAEAARSAGIHIETPCGGAGICGKCRVTVNGSENVPACQTTAENDMTVSCCNNPVGDDAHIVPLSAHIVPPAANNVPADNTYGIAVDIGTTNIVAALHHLPTGRCAGRASVRNPQCVYAADVIGRIEFAGKQNGLAVLHDAFMSAFHRLTDDLTSAAMINRSDIRQAVLCGNTVMLHIAAGADVASMGRAPYRFADESERQIDAAALKLSPSAQVTLPPVISAFVGADVTCGILACRLWEKKGTALLIDLGTNGEIAAVHNGRLTAASAAAGPAFEGVGIEYGTRFVPGAVTGFRFAQNGEHVIQTAGNEKAVGICGSGIIEITSELLRAGIIDETGRMTPEPFHITDGITVSQRDIRQIQLAKGAVYTAVTVMLDRLSVQPEDVGEVIIAGAFGEHVSEKSMINIGLLPACFKGKITFAGNTALSGAAELLCNEQYRDELRDAAAKAEHLDLSAAPEFQNRFAEAMLFSGFVKE
jgi:uncharacterized 2Fe-2S/4Fe-4S cluster protein (DUF4445 family)